MQVRAPPPPRLPPGARVLTLFPLAALSSSAASWRAPTRASGPSAALPPPPPPPRLPRPPQPRTSRSPSSPTSRRPSSRPCATRSRRATSARTRACRCATRARSCSSSRTTRSSGLPSRCVRGPSLAALARPWGRTRLEDQRVRTCFPRNRALTRLVFPLAAQLAPRPLDPDAPLPLVALSPVPARLVVLVRLGRSRRPLDHGDRRRTRRAAGRRRARARPRKGRQRRPAVRQGAREHRLSARGARRRL